MTPSLDGWPIKVKETPSPHEIRLTPLDTNPVFQCLGEDFTIFLKDFLAASDKNMKLEENKRKRNHTKCRYRSSGTTDMELFVTIVDSCESRTFLTQNSSLNLAGLQDLSLHIYDFLSFQFDLIFHKNLETSILVRKANNNEKLLLFPLNTVCLERFF